MAAVEASQSPGELAGYSSRRELGGAGGGSRRATLFPAQRLFESQLPAEICHVPEVAAAPDLAAFELEDRHPPERKWLIRPRHVRQVTRVGSGPPPFGCRRGLTRNASKELEPEVGEASHRQARKRGAF